MTLSKRWKPRETVLRKRKSQEKKRIHRGRRNVRQTRAVFFTSLGGIFCCCSFRGVSHNYDVEQGS